MNKTFLPPKDFIKSMKLPKHDSVALYNQNENITLVVKKVKSSKYVGLVTTMHNEFTVVEGTKTEAHMFYNAGKGGTDAFDQRCAVTSCSRRSQRWPMTMFFQLINIAMNNAYILFSAHPMYNHRQYSEKAVYLKDVAYNMCRPFALMRHRQLRARHEYIKVMLRMAFRIPEEPAYQVPAVAAPPPPAAEEPIPADAEEPVAAVAAPPPPAAEEPVAAVAAPPPPAAEELLPVDAAAVPRFRRDIPIHPVGRIPYRGGRNTLSSRQRCNFCGKNSGWRGRLMCESNGCARSVCLHHSVILCQLCYHGDT